MPMCLYATVVAVKCKLLRTEVPCIQRRACILPLVAMPLQGLRQLNSDVLLSPIGTTARFTRGSFNFLRLLFPSLFFCFSIFTSTIAAAFLRHGVRKVG
jgi:hypothetical protein